ncbi:MAG: response regulator [Planctomycetota bacterium]
MTSSTGETRTILIVDDEERLRRALERSLCQGNWQTQAAACGEEALGILQQEHVDLVITDLVMPGMDGMRLVRKIKSAVPDTEVIILTAYGSPESMDEAEKLGVGGYLAKPFDLAYLKSKVNELLAASEVSGASCSELSCRAAPRVLRVLCSGSGKTMAVIVALPRQALHCIRPRYVLLAAGRVVGAVSGLFFGTRRLASVFKKTR